MARLGTAFNAQEHDTEQRNDYPELPNGIYRMEMTASDVIPTSKGDGTVLKTTFTIIEPDEFVGRLLFNNYNLENPNPQAQEIGQKQFASLCRAAEVLEVEDSEELHLRPFIAKVGLGKPQYEKVNGVVQKDASGNPIEKYPARAEIKRYYFPDSDDMPTPAIDANQPAAAATPKPANDNRPAAASRPAAAAAQPAARRPWGSK